MDVKFIFFLAEKKFFHNCLVFSNWERFVKKTVDYKTFLKQREIERKRKSERERERERECELISLPVLN